MPTDISNQLGTERQFNARPDAMYQGRYQSVQATQKYANTDGLLSLADNFNKLSVALGNALAQNEKLRHDKGFNEAKHMIEHMSRASELKMNIIDYAQANGFASSVDNPYFRAYAEKIRGGYLARKMKDEYDEMYAMEPLASMDEETERYDKFRREYANDIYKSAGRPTNEYAFDVGFDESNLLNQNKLAEEWKTKKHNEDIVVTMSEAQSKLGNIIMNAPALLQENGAMTKSVQEVSNITRLAGVDPQVRNKLFTQFALKLMSTGSLDFDRFKQMADNVTLSTIANGEQKLSDILDMSDMKLASQEFARIRVSQAEDNFIEDAIGKWTLDDLSKWAEKEQKDKPLEAPHIRDVYERIHRGIEHREQVRRQEQQMANMQAILQGKNQNAYNIAEQAVDMIRYNKGILINGRDIRSYNLPDDVLRSAWNKGFMDCVQQGDIDGAFNLLNFPDSKISSMRKDIATSINDTLYSLKMDKDGNVQVPAEVKNMMAMLSARPNRIEGLFGTELADKALILSEYFRASNGDWNDVGRKFYAWNNAPKDDKVAVKSEVTKLLNSNGLVAHLVDFMTVGSGNISTRPVAITGSNALMRTTIAVASSKVLGENVSAEGALNGAGDLMSQNSLFYHDAIFPRGIYSNCAVNGSGEAVDAQNAFAFRQALDDAVYETDVNNPADVTVMYKGEEDRWIFRGSNGKVTYKTTSDLRRFAHKLAEKGALNLDSNALQGYGRIAHDNISMTVGQLNQLRASSNTNSIYQGTTLGERLGDIAMMTQ